MLAQLRAQGRGLTRPELSVLTAYAKIWLFDEIIASTAPDDPQFEQELFAYFPEAIRGFEEPIRLDRMSVVLL